MYLNRWKQRKANAGRQTLSPSLRILRAEALESRRLLAVSPLHVDADSAAPDPDGAGWDTAFVDLQDALDQAAALNADADPQNDVADIWIADGTYVPSKDKHGNAVPDDARTVTFSLLSGVSLYGGFAGTETSPDDRPTDPGGGFVHETILSGDLLANDDPGSESSYDDNAYTVVFVLQPVKQSLLDGFTISDGRAEGYDPNRPEWAFGGGIYNDGTLTVTNSTISRNLAFDGGGIYSTGTLTVASSAISDNSARGINFRFGFGGGIYSTGTLTITGSTFSGNSGVVGGGIYNSGTLSVANSTISGNSAYWDGGGICSGEGTLSVTNSTISGNSARSGGGILNYDGTLTVTNSTISGNSASSGGGISNYGTLTVTNSIVSLNATDADSYGDLDDIYGPLTAESASNLIGIDPQFVRNPSPGPDGSWDTEDDDPGDLRLTAASPAVNFGNNNAVPPELTTDLDGLPRIHGGRVDIGAYEYQADLPSEREIPSPLVTTLADSVNLYDGVVSLREALFYCDVEEVNGPITFDASLDGGRITLAGDSLLLLKSVRIDAALLGSLTIHGDSKSRVFTIRGDEVELIGLTIIGGSAGGDNNGGGIYNFGTLTVTGSTLRGNSARSSGGGIYNTGTLTVITSILSGNSAGSWDGGGIYNSGTLTVTNSILSGNSSSGIYNTGTSTVTNSTISGNSGHGVDTRSGTLTLTNSIVFLNARSVGSEILGPLTAESGFNLIGVDPKFVDNPSPGPDGTWRTADDNHGDLRLTAQSPALNVGNSDLLPPDTYDLDHDGDTTEPIPFDLDYDPRIENGTVDIGAYEYQGDPATGRETASTIVTTANDTVNLHDGDVSLREALYYASLALANGPVIFHASLDGAVITLDGSSLFVAGTIQIDASSLGSLTISGANKSQVVTVAVGQTELIGLTITGGSGSHGGGISNFDTLVVINSTIARNSAHYGGGIYSGWRSTLTVTGSTISGNSASHDGGGIRASGTLTVANSTFSDNLAIEGGGIFNSGTSTVTGAAFSGNSATGRGGGGISSRGSLAITSSTILGNSTDDDGGGILNSWGGTLTVTDSTISGNSARMGSGICNWGTLTIGNSVVSGNSAFDHEWGGYGGGIYNTSTLAIANSTITGNSAWSGRRYLFSGVGGGIFNDDSGTVTVTNSTISANSAEYDGGGIYNMERQERGVLTAHNTIVSGNIAHEEGPDVHGVITDTSSYNLIGDGSGMSGIVHGENGNLVGTAESPVDPRFVRTPFDGDLRLRADSPAIDAGENSLAPDELPVDLDGNPRILDGDNDGIATVDMGAYEYLDTQLLHPGDANFDGVTDLSDFNIWNANKYTDGAVWATGDFNGDGVTDLSDFNIWNANKFTSALTPVSVDGALKESQDDSLDKLAWLYETEQFNANERSSSASQTTETVVDKLLASYWPGTSGVETWLPD